MKMSEEQFQVFLDGVLADSSTATFHEPMEVVITRVVGKHERTLLLKVPILSGDLYYDTAVRLGWDPDDKKIDDPLWYLSKRRITFIKRVSEDE